MPLVADISSCILSEPIDVSRFALLYAGAQKNMAPAGLTVVIIREDMIGEPMDITPTMFKYSTHADNGSMYNTCLLYTSETLSPAFRRRDRLEFKRRAKRTACHSAVKRAAQTLRVVCLLYTSRCV